MPPKKAKQGPQEPSSSAVPSRDIHQRLNYLYQASVFLSTAFSSSVSTASPNPISAKRDKGKRIAKAFLIPTQAGQAGGEMTREEADSRAGAEQVGDAGAEGEGMKQGEVRNEGIALVKQLERNPRASTSALRPVSSMLVRTMRDVAKKSTLRMDPTVKRTLCKCCSTILIPGLTCHVRVKPSRPHAHLIISTCLNCPTRRRLPAPPHLPPAPVPPESTPITIGMEAESGMDVDVTPPTDKVDSKRTRMTKREKKEKRQARRPTFFEREGHVTFAGAEKVVRDM